MIGTKAATAAFSCRCQLAWSNHGLPGQEPGGDRSQGPFPKFIDLRWPRRSAGDHWLHEIKFDGYWVQLQLAHETVRILTRCGHDWTKRPKKVADDGWRISSAPRSSTARSRSQPPTVRPIFRCSRTSCAASPTRSSWSLFDLIYLKGYELRKLPLVQRKAHLKKAGHRYFDPIPREFRGRRRGDVRARLRYGTSLEGDAS